MSFIRFHKSFPTGSPQKKLLLNLIEHGYFDFLISSCNKNLLSDYLCGTFFVFELATKYSVSRARIFQLLNQWLKKIATPVNDNLAELQSLYNQSIDNPEMQNKLEACCCKIVGLSFLCPSQQNITDTADINSYVISQRLKNIIKSMGIISLSQFSEFNLWDFLKQRNFGKKTLEELERFLQNNNIKLKEREIEQSQLVYVFPQWYDNYQLSGRFINVLRQLEINSLHHLSNITFEQFAFSRNVGKTTIDELIQLLHQTGIQIKAINHPVVNLSYNKEFRLRTYYALKNIVDDHSITHLSQLSNYSESYFLKLGGRGKTGVAELKQLLLHNGIKLKEE